MKTSFSILFYLKKGGQKVNGKMPVMGRITVNGKNIQFSTKIDVTPDLWNTKAEKAIGRGNESREVNSILESIRASLIRIYHDLRERGKDATPESIKNIYFGTELSQRGLLQLFKQYHAEFQSMVGSYKKKSSYVLPEGF